MASSGEATARPHRRRQRVYVAHAVTSSPVSLAPVHALVYWLRSNRFNVTVPRLMLLPDEVLARSAIEGVERADIVIADLSARSHGVGFEVGWAAARGKVVLAIAAESTRDQVSKFLTCLFPTIIYYSASDDLIEAVRKAIETTPTFDTAWKLRERSFSRNERPTGPS